MSRATRMPSRREMAGQIGAGVVDLIKSRVRDASDGKTKFTDSDDNWGAAGGFGAYTSMQGLRAVMGGLMAVRFDDTLWAASLPHIPSLLDEWRAVLDDGDRSTTSKPYTGYHRFGELMEELGADVRVFTDAASWLLSTALVVHSVLPDLQERGIDVGDLLARTQSTIVEALKLLVNAQLRDGGWHFGGFSENGAGHLFFTWGVLQGFADFSDYVLGESFDEIGVAPDTALMTLVGEALIEAFKHSRNRASAFLKRAYLDPALAEGLDYKILSTVPTSSSVRISVENVGGEIPLLYSYAYLQESLILNGVDKDGIPELEYEPATARADMKALQEIIRDRFKRAQAEITDAPDREAAVNISTFFLRARAQKKKGPAPPEYVFKDPSLWPQLVRTFVLYPYYVARTGVPDSFAFEALALLMDDRRSPEEQPGSGLWDHDAFNLSVTSRAVEALIDIYDYVELFERTEPTSEQPTAPLPPAPAMDLAAMLAEALAPHVRSMVRDHVATTSTSPARSIDVEEVKQDLQDWMGLTLQLPFKLIRSEIEKKWKSSSGLTFDQVAQEVHGAADAGQFEHEDDLAYAIFQAMAGITFYTFAKCLPQLIEQALLYVATEEQRRLLRKKLKKQESTLHDEVLHQMQALVTQLIERPEESVGETPVGGPVPLFPQAKTKEKTR